MLPHRPHIFSSIDGARISSTAAAIAFDLLPHDTRDDARDSYGRTHERAADGAMLTSRAAAIS
jgi:hypothetical protein